MWPYILFDTPRVAKVALTGDNYIRESGWEIIYKDFIVIGEDRHSYITEFKECIELYPDGIKQYNYFVKIGFHKSRLVNWVDTQMKLF